MNLSDFLDMVRPGLEPDIPHHRRADLLAGDDPQDHDEVIWLEWHAKEVADA